MQRYSRDMQRHTANRASPPFLLLSSPLGQNLEERNRNVGTRKKKIKRDNEIRKSKITLQNGLKELWEMLAHERSRGKRVRDNTLNNNNTVPHHVLTPSALPLFLSVKGQRPAQARGQAEGL